MSISQCLDFFYIYRLLRNILNKKMAYLQLAERDFSMLAAANYDKYVFIPQGFRGAVKDTYVREDLFDDLPENVYNQLMLELESFNKVGLSDKASRAARRSERKSKKEAKQSTRGAAARRDARQKRIETKQAGKTERTKAGGGLGGLIDKAGNIIGGIMGTNQKTLDVTAGGGDLSVDYSGGEETPTFWDQYKWPILIGGGLVAAVVGYSVLKKK